MMTFTKSIRFAGKGGQGIIFSGIALARAFALYEKVNGKELYAYETQSYGPEARGGASKCDVKVSDTDSVYPFVEIPDYLILMSQPAYEKYISETKNTTVVMMDQGNVRGETDLEHYYIPATIRAEEIGAKIVANVIMLGAFVEISGIISEEAVVSSLRDISPEGSKDLNNKAFRLGVILGKQIKVKNCDDG